jgi:16S rRNA (uracil1498-N3)-methyltransferase
VEAPGRGGAAWPASVEAVAHVFVDALDDECVIEGPDGHHLQRARRLHEGEAVTAADGSGHWRHYRIIDVAPGHLRCRALEPVKQSPPMQPAVAAAVALTKGRGLDDVIAGLTELGVARIEPIRTERSVVRWDDERAAAAVDRWCAIAREAAMQSRRATIPEVAAVASVRSLAGRPGLVVADRTGGEPAELPQPGDSGWLVVVGPEGGLSPEELGALGDVPRLAVGRFVLRAQTAPLAVVAALVARSTGVPHVVN